MFTEQSLREHPSLVKAFMGSSAEQFWELIEQMSEQFATYTQQRHQRAERHRAVGGGRSHDLSLTLRSALVLTYLRLHIPQATVAALFAGATQSDVSRDLRNLLPLIQLCLPCPLVWEEVPAEQVVPETMQLSLADLTDGRVLIDATEQRIGRPRDSSVQKA
jgi:hypothetical protein